MPPFVSKLKRTYWEVTDLEKNTSNVDLDPYPHTEVSMMANADDANTIASLLEGEGEVHAPAIDIDWHCELREVDGEFILDIWCDWPIDLFNVSNNQLVLTGEITKYCKALQTFNIVQAAFFSGRDNVIRYRIEFSAGIEAVLIPSKTPDHFHLYIETVLPWNKYQDFIHNLNQMGIVQKGFFEMTQAREKSHLRKPSSDLFVIE